METKKPMERHFLTYEVLVFTKPSIYNLKTCMDNLWSVSSIRSVEEKEEEKNKRRNTRTKTQIIWSAQIMHLALLVVTFFIT